MKSIPAVSILVTVYNREDFVAEALESILQSRFSDFEIVVVDDASSDASCSIVEQYVRADNRIRLFRNTINLGDYGNRSKAISLAKSDLVKFVDADDLIYPQSLEVMVDAMRRHPDSALGLSQSLGDPDRPYPFVLSPREAYHEQCLGSGCLNCGPSGAIFRRSAYDESGGFRNWGVLSDTDLWLRMAAKWPVVLLPPALVWWRRHEGQEFERGRASGEYLEQGFRLAREALSSPECPLSEEERNRALDRAKQHHARRILALATRGGKPKEAMRLARDSGLSIPEFLRGFRPYQ